MKYIILIAALFCLPVSAQVQGNLGATLLPSAAQTAATVVTSDIVNPNWRGAHIVVNVTSFTSGTYTPTVQGKDPVSGVYYTILAGAAISGTGTTILRIYPGITAASNTAVSDILPRTWRVSFAGASTPSMTFSVGASYDQ